MPSTRLRESWPRLVAEPYETRSVEHKGPEDWERVKHPIARAALGLSNLRSGGFIVVGVATIANDQLSPVGLSAAQVATFRHDEVHDFISSFAQAGLSLRGDVMSHEGRDYYVIEVDQFERVPTVSRKDSPPEHKARGVTKDTTYVRTRGKVETRAANAEELAEILELAIDDGVRQYIERAARVGLNFGDAPAGDDDRYGAERGDL